MVRIDYPHIIDPALIEEAAVTACGIRPLALNRRQQNQSRVTYEITLPDARHAFLKAEKRTPGKSWSIALEAWALEQAAALAIPVPRVLALDCSEARFPFRWLLLSAIPGVHLTDADLDPKREAKVLRQCGELLTRLHGICTEGFGALDDDLYLDTGVVRGPHETWNSFVLGQARSDARLLTQAGMLTAAEAESCIATIEMGVPDLRQGCLVHGDFDRNHVFVEPATGDLVGIIDFGARESACPEWELSWPCIFDTEDAAAAIIDGYKGAGGAIDPAALDCYISIRLLWLARYRHERGQARDAAAARDRLLALLARGSSRTG